MSAVLLSVCGCVSEEGASDVILLVTPSGMDYNRITPEHIVKVEIETLKYKGVFKPTSESPLHSAEYRTRTDAAAVIHTHTDYSTA